jgi:hypothetical protein
MLGSEAAVVTKITAKAERFRVAFSSAEDAMNFTTLAQTGQHLQVRLWPSADIGACTARVRFQGRSRDDRLRRSAFAVTIGGGGGGHGGNVTPISMDNNKHHDGLTSDRRAEAGLVADFVLSVLAIARRQNAIAPVRAALAPCVFVLARLIASPQAALELGVFVLAQLRFLLCLVSRRIGRCADWSGFEEPAKTASTKPRKSVAFKFSVKALGDDQAAPIASPMI